MAKGENDPGFGGQMTLEYEQIRKNISSFFGCLNLKNPAFSAGKLSFY